MAQREDSDGCRRLLEWASVVILALGIVPFVPLQGTGFTAFLMGWMAMVAASVVMTACAASAGIDRVAPTGSGRPRGGFTVLATLLVGAMTVWSLWLLLGPPATGTLSEAVPLIVDPPLAAAVAVVLTTRSERAVVFAFVLAAIVALVVMLRFVGAVGPSYAG